MQVVGIDFGTTNTVIARVDDAGQVVTARIAHDGDWLDTTRSVLCFWQDLRGGKLRHAAGQAAIDAYLDGMHDSRLIMSMKSFLAQASFADTSVFGRIMTLPQLIALLLASALHMAGIEPAQIRVVAGRPVRFVGDAADDALGAQRLRDAFAQAGVADVELALEPEAAGYRFTRGLARDTNVLIGDFGGGTSDFSVLRFQPGQEQRVVPLGHAGIGLAGDAFDFRIIDNVVSPLLGKNDTYRVFGNDLPIPAEYYASFARWHRLSVMRTPKMLRDMEEVARMSSQPDRLRGLIRLIDEEKAYDLYRAVSQVKAQLSSQADATLHFEQAGVRIVQPIARAAFEAWIAPDLARLETAIGDAVAEAGLRDDQVDRVFLTGGTSFVPAVRALFTRRFGADKIAMGGEFVSVAEGLALIGQDRSV